MPFRRVQLLITAPLLARIHFPTAHVSHHSTKTMEEGLRLLLPVPLSSSTVVPEDRLQSLLGQRVSQKSRRIAGQRRHNLTSTGHRQLHRLRLRLPSSVLTGNYCPSTTRQHTGADAQDLVMIVSLNWPPATVEGSCDLRWHTLQRCLVGTM